MKDKILSGFLQLLLYSFDPLLIMHGFSGVGDDRGGCSIDGVEVGGVVGGGGSGFGGGGGRVNGDGGGVGGGGGGGDGDGGGGGGKDGDGNDGDGNEGGKNGEDTGQTFVRRLQV